MHSHFSLSLVRYELVEALLGLDHSHVLIGVGEDVPEVLGVVTVIVADSNYRIPQLIAQVRISHKEEMAKDFCLRLLDSRIELFEFID